MTATTDITADAVALQERDEFREDGWVKVLSPAKVNLHLAIGERRSDGYHDAATVMHALNLHDVVYLRRAVDEASCRMVPAADISLPDIPARDNLALKAVARLADALGMPAEAAGLEIRIEKNIPAQAGLGGGSSNAAAALVGAARLWGLALDDSVETAAGPASSAAPSGRRAATVRDAIEAAARSLGADVAFFLHGGCAYLEGTGNEFVHALKPSKRAVVLVKPDGGVSTAEAYRRFDERPAHPTGEQANRARSARAAGDVALFNNLAPASESLMPELAEVRTWLGSQPRLEGALLCGSGAATFALCDDLAAATSAAAAARARGWWARATSLGSLRAIAAGGPHIGTPAAGTASQTRVQPLSEGRA